MKLSIRQMGGFLAATICVLLCLVGFSVVIPEINAFSATTLAGEKNMINEFPQEGLTLSADKTSVRAPAGRTLDIFNGLTALSSDGTNLLPELQNDYRKPLPERKAVFIYKLDREGASILVPKIDTTLEGQWAVLFLLEQGSSKKTVRVNYEIYEPWVNTEDTVNGTPDRI